MRLLLLILLSISLAPLAQAMSDQTADDFFNSGAQLYISNNIPSALERTENGLKLYPDNVKLQKLEKLLKQQQKQNNQSKQNQQQNQKNQQNQQNKSNQQQSKNNQQKQQQQNSDEKKNQEQNQQQKQQAENKQEQNKQQPSQANQEQNKSGEKKNEEQGKPVAAGQMTPKEAKQLLNTQKGNEKFLTLKPPEKPRPNNQPVKDW